MDTISQLPDPAAWCQGKKPPVSIEYRRQGCLHSQSQKFGEEKNFCTMIETEQSAEDWFQSVRYMWIKISASLLWT